MATPIVLPSYSLRHFQSFLLRKGGFTIKNRPKRNIHNKWMPPPSRLFFFLGASMNEKLIRNIVDGEKYWYLNLSWSRNGKKGGRGIVSYDNLEIFKMTKFV